MNQLWLLRLLRWSYVAFIAQASIVAIMQGVRSGGHDHSALSVALGTAEALAAIALLFEPLEAVASAVLLTVFAAAAAVSMTHDDHLPLRFAYYAMTAIFIVAANRRQAVPEAG